jgi:hypothetical protein
MESEDSVETITSRKRILVAVRHAGLKCICDALGSEFDVSVVHTVEEAQSRLVDDISAIVCGVHFDGGQMLDFLAYVKSRPDTRAIPFFVALGSDRGYSGPIVNAIRIATGVLGSQGFIDLSGFMNAAKQEQAYQNFRFGIREIASAVAC